MPKIIRFGWQIRKLWPYCVSCNHSESSCSQNRGILMFIYWYSIYRLWLFGQRILTSFNFLQRYLLKCHSWYDFLQKNTSFQNIHSLNNMINRWQPKQLSSKSLFKEIAWSVDQIGGSCFLDLILVRMISLVAKVPKSKSMFLVIFIV